MAMLVQTWGQDSGDNHSYEEIRRAAFVVLKGASEGGQYVGLRSSIAQHYETTEGRQGQAMHGYRQAELSTHDANLYMEVFWSLFREGIITLGANDLNPNFPFYRVTEFGRKILNNQDPYFFTDVSDYERLLRTSVPDIDDVTMLYVKEAVQTFKIGSVLASSVMIGVASEHTFNRVVETIEENTDHKSKFDKVFKQTRILTRLNEFKKVLDAHPELLTSGVKEDLDTRFMGIVSLIRTFRNEAGHPTGKILDREQAYVNLQLFIPYAGKLYQLMALFK